jgi:hypothetical protein
MKYKLTVWNVIIVFLIPFITFTLLSKDADPNTVIAAAYLIPILIIGALIDLVLQILIKNRKTLAIVEIVSLTAIIVIGALP